MSKGRRYSSEGQLNLKKVFAVIIAVVVIIMFIFIIRTLLTSENENTSVDYYALYADDAWGIIDSEGNKVIEPMYQEMIVVINNSRDVFLCTYDVNEETGEYKTKAINKNNEEIYTNYDKIEALENYDESGNLWYEQDILKVEKDGLYGVIDIDGKEIISVQYDSITTLKGIENSLIVEKDGLYGLVNDSGVTIIQPQYTQITNLGDEYKQGYITIDQEGKYGVVSYSGTQILENKYEKIDQIYGENYLVIEEEGKQKLINLAGEEIISEGYDKITQIATSGVIFTKDKKYGVMGYDGEEKIEAKYDKLEEINTDIYVAKSGKNYGIIDINENEKLSFGSYVNIYYSEKAGIYVAEDSSYNDLILDSEFNVKLTGILSELNTDSGYIKIRIDDEYKYYNFKFEEKNEADIKTENTLFISKQNGKYGFVDKDGNVKVDYLYDDVTDQNEYGYAAVKKDGLWGAIDSDGQIVIEPIYDLDENLIVDFIGKWHLGQDINMNYYCEK